MSRRRGFRAIALSLHDVCCIPYRDFAVGMTQMSTSSVFAGLEGIVQENYPLAKHTWYQIGGPARYFILPTGVEDLQEAVKRCAENNIPIFVLGLGANLLVGDQGVHGAVFRFDQEHWRKVKIDGSTLEVGAGVDMQKLVLHACRSGLSGTELAWREYPARSVAEFG